jgi:putative aldouronate transport system substrate-binding protein
MITTLSYKTIFFGGNMKRTVSILVILIMATALVFMGCNRQTTTDQSGPIKLTVEIFDRGTDGGRTQVTNNAWTDWIKEKVLKDLNIELTFFPVGRWSEDTDIINLMASASAPDLCYTYNTQMIGSFRDQGGILDVSPLIDRLLPDMKKLLGKDPAIQGQDFIYRDRDPATGRIYSIPSYVIEARAAQRNIFIRKDWLDKLGLAIPRTTQEFHDALVAFRDRDPGNVGRNNVIPFGQDSDARWGFASIVYAFFDPSLSDRDMWIYSFSDRPIYVPGYKEGMRMMNQWYNENLIFRDFPLMTVADDYTNLLKTGFIGAFSGNWDLPWRTDYKIAEELAVNVPGAQFVPVDCIQAPDGITRKYISDKPGLRIFVPAFSKNQEAALRYLNWLCLYDNFHFLQVGTEGINHQLVNGVPQIMAAPAGSPWFQNSSQNIDMTLPMNGVEMMNFDLTSRVLALSYGNTPPDIIVNALNISVTNGRAPVVYQAATTKDGIYNQVLADKANALIAQAVTAPAARFDSVWDAGIRDWLQSGAQEVMDERASLWPR